MRPSPTAYVVAGLHVLGWGALLLTAVSPLGIGLGVTAYLLGLRHAFDADHIAAIDNTTRRLLARGRRARGVGLWFSLGHATIVSALCVLLALGVGALAKSLEDPGSPLQVWTGVIGPVVSGVFLLLIGAANILLLRHRRQTGSHRHGGPAWALLGRFDAVIDRPSRMYVVGLLFGLGFDTATEVGLLALAGTAASRAVPWSTILILPVLFAAGMSLLDSAQGAMSRRAYSWGAEGGESKVRRYDLLVTGASIVVALVIGVAELAGVALRSLPHPGGIARALGELDLNVLGLVLTGALIVFWAGAVAWSGLERRRPSVQRSPGD